MERPKVAFPTLLLHEFDPHNMLVLSTLHTLLSQIIAPPNGLHTAILSTPSGNHLRPLKQLVRLRSLRPSRLLRIGKIQGRGEPHDAPDFLQPWVRAPSLWQIRVIVGLSGEVWQETLSLGPSENEKERMGMVSSEVSLRSMVVSRSNSRNPACSWAVFSWFQSTLMTRYCRRRALGHNHPRQRSRHPQCLQRQRSGVINLGNPKNRLRITAR